MGGDEFLVLDWARDEATFRGAVQQALEALALDHISAAAGISWREGSCDVRQQMEEADRLMYEEKSRYHQSRRSQSGQA